MSKYAASLTDRVRREKIRIDNKFPYIGLNASAHSYIRRSSGKKYVGQRHATGCRRWLKNQWNVEVISVNPP
jgi:hypothetical protein